LAGEFNVFVGLEINIFGGEIYKCFSDRIKNIDLIWSEKLTIISTFQNPYPKPLPGISNPACNFLLRQVAIRITKKNSGRNTRFGHFLHVFF